MGTSHHQHIDYRRASTSQDEEGQVLFRTSGLADACGDPHGDIQEGGLGPRAQSKVGLK